MLVAGFTHLAVFLDSVIHLNYSGQTQLQRKASFGSSQKSEVCIPAL
jgi:hypothetical protein